MGPVPTLVFKETTTQLSGMDFGSSNSGPSYGDLQKKVASMESELKEVANVKSQMQALFAYISAKEGGKIPDELADLFTSSTQQEQMHRTNCIGENYGIKEIERS